MVERNNSSSNYGVALISPSESPASRPCVLVVEDHEDTREMLRTILELQDFSVLEAGDGQVGFQLAVDGQPDLILMDLTLPRVDGVEATKAIRNHADVSEVPIIFLSARAEPASMTAAFAAGCNDYLTKPLKLDDVLLKVQRWLGGKDDSCDNC